MRDQISEIPNLRCTLLALILLILASPAFATAPKFPALTGRVVDDAGILDASTTTQLTDMLAAHERATGQQVVVVTLDSLQGFTIEDYGYQLGRYWGIGQKGKNTGALLIVAPKEHKVRIEVGYGLEGELTDAISATIIQNDILPNFKRGDFSAGVVAGTTSILKVLGGNPPEVQGPATSSGEGHVSPAGSANIQPLSFPQVVGLIAGLMFNPILLIVILLMFFILPRSANRGGWRSGGGSSWGSSNGGGGGFSGGGGSFGGGGASGSW
ncbi:MAG: TPM domain-containing protein [Candidatus Binatus sp.]